MKGKNIAQWCCCILLLTLYGCSTVDRMPRAGELGAGVGEHVGASFGKKNGNSAVCAVIGAALCGSAGNVLDRYIANLTGAGKPSLYVVNGVPYPRKKALSRYKHINKEDIRSVVRMDKEEAVARYGSIGEKGALIIALNADALSSERGN